MATTARPTAPGRITQSSEVQQAPRADQAEEHPGRGREVLRPAGHLAALLHPRGHAGRDHVPGRARLRRVVDPRVPGDQRERHAAPAGRLHRVRGPGALGADALAHLRHLRPGHPRALHAAIRGSSRSRPRSTSRPAASPRRRTGDPRPSSSSSTRSASTRTPTRATTTSTRRRGSGTRAGTGRPTWGTARGTRRATSRSRRSTGCRTCARKIMLALIDAGVPVEVQHHEVATAGQAEIDFRFGTLVQTADRLLAYKYIVKNVCHNLGSRPRSCPSRCSATTARACTCTSRSGRVTRPLFFDENGLRAPLGDRPALHRRPDRARAGAARPLRAHHQQLPAAGARLRGAGQPDVLGAEPVGDLPDPDVLAAAPRPSGWSSAPPTRRANPYLAFAAMLMAGLDGIKRKLEPPAPIDEDLYEIHDERKTADQDRCRAVLAEAIDGAGAGPRLPARGGRVHPRRAGDLDQR